MNKEKILELIEFQKTFFGIPIINSINSIGSIILFDVPVSININEDPNYVIIGNAAWRITKNDKFIVGSGDDREKIKCSLEDFIGLKITDFLYLDKYLNVQICLENGYAIETFFHWRSESQWELCMTSKNYGIDLNLLTTEEIDETCNSSPGFFVEQKFKEINIGADELIIEDIFISDYSRLNIHFEDRMCCQLEEVAWRIDSKKDNVLLCQCFEEPLREEAVFNSMIGQKLHRIEVSENLMDARFFIGDDIVLHAFAGSAEKSLWVILKGDALIYEARNPLNND